MTLPAAVGSRAAAAVVILRALGLARPVRQPPFHDVALDGVPGRIWLPTRPSPPVLLPVGVTELGPADPRLMRLAGAIAARGRLVFAPRLELSRRRLDTADVERVGRAAKVLADHPLAEGPVTVLGFSFGGSYAILAAADPDVAARLRLVAAFGAYADLRTFLQDILDRADAAARRAASDALLNYGEEELDEDAREALDRVLRNDAPVDSLPAPVLSLLERLSPVTVAGKVDVPLSLLHAVEDPVIPARELDRLARAFPHARLHQLRAFTHVDFVPGPERLFRAVGDLATLWGFASDVLADGR